MSRWAEPIREFHQLLTPDGNVYDLHTASKNGRWVISSQGWGMPPIGWITQSSPFQHGATVRDYRLQPRVIQLLLHQSYCDRESLWDGRSNLLAHLRPNRLPVTFDDYWTPRSQYQAGEIYPAQSPQSIIAALAQWGGSLYGGSGDDPYGTGGVLLKWDGGGSWAGVGYNPLADDGSDIEYGTRINCLLPATITVPTFTYGQTPIGVHDSYTTGEDAGIRSQYLCAQTITPAADFTLSSVKLKLRRVGNPGNPNVGITAMGSGTPQGGNGSYHLTNWANIAANTITTEADGAWYEFPFTASYRGLQVAGGTQYAICMYCANQDASNYIEWRCDETVPGYAGGSRWYRNAPGDAWAADASVDYMFEVYGYTFTNIVSGEEEKGVLLAGCGADAIMAVWQGARDASSGALSYGAETDVLSLCQFGDDVYAGTAPNGLLLRYYVDLATGHGAWELCADTLVATSIYSLAVFEDNLYAGTNGGLLYRWNTGSPGSWTQVCAQADGTETAIRALKVYAGNLYGVGDNGILYLFDGGAWDAVSDAVDPLRALEEWKGRLYAAGEDGLLYRWNNADAWEEVCDPYIGAGAVEEINALKVFQGRLFGGTNDGAYLLEYLHSMSSRQPQCTTLRRVLPDGRRRDLCVFISEGPKFDDMTEGWREHSFREMLRLVAYNPVMYDPEMQTVTYLLGTGAVAETEDITYEGTWEEHPTLVLTGPMNAPIIINTALDTHIAFDYNIPDGDVVTVNLNDLTVVDSNNTNLLGVITTDSNLATFRLEPNPVVPGGVNPVTLMANGLTANSDFEIQFYLRFLGI